MSNLGLDAHEHEILVEVLKEAVSDLGVEIAGTDDADYRSGLKDKKQAVMRILERLRQAAG